MDLLTKIEEFQPKKKLKQKGITRQQAEYTCAQLQTDGRLDILTLTPSIMISPSNHREIIKYLLQIVPLDRRSEVPGVVLHDPDL